MPRSLLSLPLERCQRLNCTLIIKLQGQFPRLAFTVYGVSKLLGFIDAEARAVLRRNVLNMRVVIALCCNVCWPLFKCCEPCVQTLEFASVTKLETLPVEQGCEHTLNVRNVLQVNKCWRVPAEEPWTRCCKQCSIYFRHRAHERFLSCVHYPFAWTKCKAAPVAEELALQPEQLVCLLQRLRVGQGDHLRPFRKALIKHLHDWKRIGHESPIQLYRRKQATRDLLQERRWLVTIRAHVDLLNLERDTLLF
mmetsp:Transcript_152105/g.269680  ORF Transcript_152105/g.269680 Transcript_152105/m.269680 type:complete len:251 (+) Transcript_152105:427-1179(+)